MQKIYICDDNKIQLIKIKNIIQEEILKQEYNMKIEKCYTSSDELIFDTMESKETNIYFLDVCIESENSGFKTAIEVRNRQPNAFIIFITSHYEFVYNVFSYHIEPLDYIVKEINEENIKKKIENCKNTAQKRWLTIAQKELEWVDQHTTKREYYLVYYADTMDKFVNLNQQIINKLRLGQYGMLEELSQEKKEDIYFKLFNPSSIIRNTAYEE